jgi:hypothetical protein
MKIVIAIPAVIATGNAGKTAKPEGPVPSVAEASYHKGAKHPEKDPAQKKSQGEAWKEQM